MSLLAPVLCLADRHKPIRRNVEWDGEAYVGKCRHCGKAIHRISENNWKQQRA